LRDEFDKLRNINLDNEEAKAHINAFSLWTMRYGSKLERIYPGSVDWEGACFTALYRAAYGFKPGPDRGFFHWYLRELRGELGNRLRTHKRRSRLLRRRGLETVDPACRKLIG
jgi:hypothetical protein